MKKLIVVFLLIMLSIVAFPTAQAPDYIIYNGKEYMLHTNPLEAYFELHPDKRPDSGIMSTNLWRGYVATFEILDDIMYLKDIEIQVSDTSSEESYDIMWVSVLDEVFPDDEKIKVTWFSGLLVLPYGEMVSYVHMGYGSTYENYILLEIDEGNLLKAKDMNYQEYGEFKDRQFEAFKKTEEYEKLKTKLQENYDSDEFIDSFIRDFVIEYSSKILTD